MPTPTYDLIASNVLGSSASSVTFSSIPATYRDLVVVVNLRPLSGDIALSLQFNSNTGNNYSYVRMAGDGSSATSAVTSNYSRFIFANFGANAGALTLLQIMDYSATDKHKSVLARTDIPTGTYPETFASANRWANTSAINSILLFDHNGNQFPTNSSFYLYGIVS